MSNIINFLSFANELYYDNLDRIRQEALNFNIFNIVYTYRNTDLKTFFPEFLDIHENYMLNNHRGYGYWIWKPYIILKTLESMNENDILVYTDAGCTLNKNGMNRFYEYIDMVKNNYCGNV